MCFVLTDLVLYSFIAFGLLLPILHLLIPNFLNSLCIIVLCILYNRTTVEISLLVRLFCVILALMYFSISCISIFLFMCYFLNIYVLCLCFVDSAK